MSHLNNGKPKPEPTFGAISLLPLRIRSVNVTVNGKPTTIDLDELRKKNEADRDIAYWQNKV